ncbi:MAG: PIG-L family deacetylase [Paracoccaceae bacterium]|nr:MAG: PIG-L family deacetylase [Paracoccaceae bacterium]
MKILAIGAHPDDVEIFVFGSLMAWRAMGAAVSVAVATDGAAGGQAPPDALRATRRSEAEAAAAALGTMPRFLDFPDGRLMADATLDRALREVIADLSPDLIVTHAPGDYHADHRALSAAVSQAANFAAPVLHMDTMGGTGFAPTHWVDVTAHWPAKCAAIRAHASQRPERFVALAERTAAFRAGECNAPPEARAEAFHFAPRFPFADIRMLLPPAPPLRPVGLPR